MSENPRPSINQLFPEKSRLLLTGGGKEFIERIGVEATRRATWDQTRTTDSDGFRNQRLFGK